jgi:hypothetical protein
MYAEETEEQNETVNIECKVKYCNVKYSSRGLCVVAIGEPTSNIRPVCYFKTRENHRYSTVRNALFNLQIYQIVRLRNPPNFSGKKSARYSNVSRSKEGILTPKDSKHRCISFPR